MAQPLTKLLSHIVFSTKERRALIDAESLPRLHAYLGGIVRAAGGVAIAVGGIADHVHLLVGLPPTVCVADMVRILKANSSKWMHEARGRKLFSWQAGYGAFSVSESNVQTVIRYIREQERHHLKISFQQEFLLHLKKHGVAYDERYIWS